MAPACWRCSGTAVRLPAALPNMSPSCCCIPMSCCRWIPVGMGAWGLGWLLLNARSGGAVDRAAAAGDNIVRGADQARARLGALELGGRAATRGCRGSSSSSPCGASRPAAPSFCLMLWGPAARPGRAAMVTERYRRQGIRLGSGRAAEESEPGSWPHNHGWILGLLLLRIESSCHDLARAHRSALIATASPSIILAGDDAEGNAPTA